MQDRLGIAEVKKTKSQFTAVAPRLHTSQLPLLLINILTALQYGRFQREDRKHLS